MGELRKDAKDLILGNDGSDKEPDDFETELRKAERNNLITESDGKKLIDARKNVDNAWNKMNDKQIKYVSTIKDGEVYESAEEELEAKKKKEKKKEEQERKRKERENKVIKPAKNNNKEEEKTKKIKEREEG